MKKALVLYFASESFLESNGEPSDNVRCREYPNLQCQGEPFRKFKDILNLQDCYEECASIAACKYFGSVSDITEGRLTQLARKCRLGHSKKFGSSGRLLIQSADWQL